MIEKGRQPMGSPAQCEGPLIWFDVDAGGAVLECCRCDYIVVSGNVNDDAHAYTPLMREGFAAA